MSKLIAAASVGDLIEDGEMRLKRKGMARDSQKWRKIVLEGKVHNSFSAFRRRKTKRILV
jgi:hypothetical protein